MNLVELLGGNRFFDHLLQQEAEECQDEADEDPRAEGPGDDTAHNHRGGEQGRRVRDDFIAHDHQSLGGLELRPNDQAEVEQHPPKHEVDERVDGKGRQDVDVQRRRHIEPAQHGCIRSVRRDQRDHLAPQVDPRDPQQLAVPYRVGEQGGDGHGECGCRNPDEQAPGKPDECGLI